MSGTDAAQNVSVNEIIEVAANVYQNGDFETAWSICRKGFDIMPQSTDLLHFMGVLSYQTGMKKLGLDLMQRATALGQKNPLDYGVVWAAYSVMNLAGLAGKLHEVALRVHECAQAGDSFWRQQQIKAAEIVYRRALAFVPESPELKSKLAKTLWEQGFYEQAESQYLEHLRTLNENASNREIKILPVKGIKTYCEQKDLKYVTVFPPEECRLYNLELFGGKTADFPETAMMPEIYAAELIDVFAFGGNTPLATGDGALLYDLAVHPQSERYELAWPCIKFCDRYKALVDFPKQDTMVIDEAIMLSGCSSTWAHWLIETLPKFSILELFPEYDKLPILLDEANVADPHNLETLNRLNRSGHEIILLKRNQRYRCKRMIVPSKLVHMPSDLKPWAETRGDDELVSPRAVNFIRREFYESRNHGIQHKRNRIYIPRKGARYRRLVNEPEIHRIFEKYGFMDVYPDKISFQEKLEIFGNAEIISGPGGSGIGNQKFAPPGTIIFNLIPETWVTNSLPPTMSALLNQRHVSVAGPILPDTHGHRYQCDYRVDPDQVEAALKMLTSSLLKSA